MTSLWFLGISLATKKIVEIVVLIELVDHRLEETYRCGHLLSVYGDCHGCIQRLCVEAKAALELLSMKATSSEQSEHLSDKQDALAQSNGWNAGLVGVNGTFEVDEVAIRVVSETRGCMENCYYQHEQHRHRKILKE